MAEGMAAPAAAPTAAPTSAPAPATAPVTAPAPAEPTGGMNEGTNTQQASPVVPEATGTNQEQQADTQAPGMDGQEKASQEPSNIAEAFQMINNNEQQRPTDDVQANSNDGEPQAGMSDQSQQVTDGQPEGQEQGANTNPNQDNGESQQQYQPVNTEYIERNLSNQINRAAQNEAAKVMAEKNVRPLKMSDLQVYDKENDRIYWNNPVNRNEPFTSMKEVNDFLDSYNKQVNLQYKEEVNKYIGQMTNAARPYVELQRFSNVYNQLDPTTQQVCAALVEDKAIYGRGRNGEIDRNRVVGFNVDYNQVLKQAQMIVKAFYGNQQQVQATAPAQQQGAQQTQSNEPALDMNTSSNTNPKMDVSQIKDVASAYKFIMQNNQ